MKTLIHHAQIVNRGKTFLGSVLIEGEYISQIFRGATLPSVIVDNSIDASGMYLLPGVIDDHVHFREPGLTQKADIKSESCAAAAGGVTSFMDMPNTLPQTTSLQAWKEKYDIAAQNSCINYAFYFGATSDNVSQLAKLDKRQVCGIKVFMGASTGNMLVSDESVLRAIFKNAKIPVAVHCEDSYIIQENVQKYTAQTGCSDLAIEYHPLIRSAEACYKSSKLAISLAKETGARLHLLHVSTAKELELLSDFSLNKKQITAEACVSHLYFTDEDYCRLGTRIKCNPSIKTAQDRAALREALVSGKIDLIGTDHAPHLLCDKEGGSLKAASGIPVIQFSLLAMLELVDEGVVSIDKVVKKMCHAPAQLFHIKKRGFIQKGFFADLVLVKPNSQWTVKTADIRSKCEWSPFENHTFQWKVDTTFVNGDVVYHNDSINDCCRGKALEFCRR